MSTITVANLPRMSREALASLLNTASKPLDSSSVAVVDVRDSDYIGGHIRGCINVPSSQLDYRVPELVRTLQAKEKVIFHCALSQQRGPSAALRYLRERERLLGPPLPRDTQQPASEKSMGVEDDNVSAKQEVFVLEGGFVQWQELYGADVNLTEGWQKDIWEFGY